MSDDSKSVVHSVAKAFAVLRAFGPDLPELTVSEIGARTDLDRGTSFRLLNTLVSLGYVAPVPGSRRYRLALKCLELGYTPLACDDLKRLSRPLLAELVADVADAASLGMLDGSDVVYVERVQGDVARSHLDRRVGSRTGIYAAALGQAILAFEPPDVQRAVLESGERTKLSERTITDIDLLLVRLAETRKKGWAFSDGENAYGLRTVAAPIFGRDGRVVAAVSATARVERCSLEAFVANGVPRVLAVTSELSQAVRLSAGQRDPRLAVEKIRAVSTDPTPARRNTTAPGQRGEN
ncbi:MAG TPA: IclR family transcriptional regulator [Telmatospirillum sp.]|nr:IclR family transcriptional regulator [Telmatospirillum sp.]